MLTNLCNYRPIVYRPVYKSWLLLQFRWSNLVKARQYLLVFATSNDFIHFYWSMENLQNRMFLLELSIVQKSLCILSTPIIVLRSKLFVLNVTIMMFAIPIIHRFAPLHHQLYNYYAISVKFTTVRVVAFGTLCHGIYMKAQLS